MTSALTRSMAEGRSDQEVAALAVRIRSEARRMRTIRQHPTGLDLAVAHDRRIVRTPALDLLNARLQETVDDPEGRLVISIPPQEGKTSLVRWVATRLLVARPDDRLAYISYSAQLARTSGRTVRGYIRQHGNEWGITVSRDHADASDWELSGHRGGMISVGREGTITGRPAEGVFIDDPLKNRKEADSPIILDSLNHIWEAVVRPRLAPGSFVVVIQTRWSEHDLAGRFESEGWPVANIPALADGKSPDALDRPIGTYLVSARGRTTQEWTQIRSDVGEIEWASLYQGMPAPPEGGWFLRTWFDRDRVSAAPADTLPPIVYVDPADNTGGGDEAGVLVGRVDSKRHIYVGPDYTQIATTARWVRIALLAVVQHEAAALVHESSLSGLPRAIREGWAELRKQAVALASHTNFPLAEWPDLHNEDAVSATMDELSHGGDTQETRHELFAELMEAWPLVPRVLAYPVDGPATRTITPRGSKLFRIQTASAAVGQRRLHLIGRLPALEHEAATWLPGKPSPNRLDTLVHMIHDLSSSAPASLSRPTGAQVPTRSTRRRNQLMIPRSTRR